MVRGEVFRLPAPKGARGREQREARNAVVVQADQLMALSTTLIAPTSTGSRPATFRPTVDIDGTEDPGSGRPDDGRRPPAGWAAPPAVSTRPSYAP